MKSKRFSLNRQEVEAVVRNALIFAGPAILVLISSFVDIVPKDSNKGIITLYVLNVILDLLKKFLKGAK